MQLKDGGKTLAERMRQALPAMSPGERRIVRVLLSLSSPEQVATVSVVAEKAGVSSPTVLRGLNKIGFQHFSAFREVALAELAAKHESALAQMTRRSARGDGQGRRMVDSLARAVLSTFDRLDLTELAAAVELLSDTQRRPIFTGGRFSHSLAEQLFAHVSMMRPGAELLSYNSHGRAGRLADVGRAHVLTVFDFRRYQRDTVELAHAAKRKRAKIVLVTDQWMSPVADWADCILVAEVRSALPFDSLVPALALVEVIIDEIYGRLGTSATERLSRLEADSESFEWSGVPALHDSGRRPSNSAELAGNG